MRGEPRAGLEARRARASSSSPRRRWSLPAGLERAGRRARHDRRRARRRRGALSDAVDPITLQVLAAALRAICDEMGAVLIRACALAEHQGAPRLLDGAVRRRRASSSCRPSTSRSTSARCPTPSRRFATASSADGRPVDPQRPVRRRHPPARHHADLAGVRTTTASCSVRRQPRPPRRRRRADPGRDAGRLAAPRGRGRRDLPRRVGDGTLEELAGRMRNPAERLADLRAQRAANSSSAPTRFGELVDRTRRRARSATGMAEILDYAERRTRAALAELADGSRTPRTSLEGARRDAHRAAGRASRRGRRDAASTSRDPPRPGRRQPQLPARRHQGRRRSSRSAC